MAWPDDLAESLPAPQDDDPPSLREDIADELADHLQSALVRERLHGADESTATQRVLARFGDPAAVARRLWFDALRERIMSQRIQLALTVVLAATSLGAVGLTWRVVEQSRAVNESILAQLTKLTSAPPQPAPAPSAPPKSTEWNPVTVRLTSGTKDGAPAEGFNMRLLKDKWNTADLIAEVTTGRDGFADLGPVSPGQYILRIQAPWSECLRQPITVSPGSEKEVHIICPERPPERTEVAVKVNWPEDLQQRGLCAMLTFYEFPRDTGENRWISPDREDQYRRLSVDPEGLVVLGGHNARSIPATLFDSDSYLAEEFTRRYSSTVSLLARSYSLRSIAIFSSEKSGDRSLRLKQLAVYEYLDESLTFVAGRHVEAIPPSLLPLMPSFVASPGETNDWKVDLPERLQTDVRLQLARSAK